MATAPVQTGYSGVRVDIATDKPFDTVVKDLQAELGKASTATLMDRLASSATFDDYTAEMSAMAGRSNLIEVAFLDWGRVLTLAGTPMRAKLFVIGNPLTASKLLAAGGPDVGLYLPTKILVYEDADGATHVSYDRFTPILEGRGNEQLTKVAGVIDGVLAKLAAAATA
ncbi:MAG: DUF302 domain-containing protein [Pseudonocardia sp.]